MTSARKCRLILKAIRAGLATNGRVSSIAIDPNCYLFDVPGGMTVDICLNQTSLQAVSAYGRQAIGGPRDVRKVTKALRLAGHTIHTAGNPWSQLADEVNP